MNSKLVSKITLTYAALLYGFFGAAWLIAPNFLGKFWEIAPGDNFTYMGNRYGAFMLGLPVVAWLVRGMPNTPARRAVMIGTIIASFLTAAASLYGALALGLNGLPAFAMELPVVLGLAWVLFIKPEPVV
jgi:hypothetical protein